MTLVCATLLFFGSLEPGPFLLVAPREAALSAASATLLLLDPTLIDGKPIWGAYPWGHTRCSRTE